MGAPMTAATRHPDRAPDAANAEPFAGSVTWLIDALEEFIDFEAAILFDSPAEGGQKFDSGDVAIERLKFQVPPMHVESVARQIISACKKSAECQERKTRQLLRPDRTITALPISSEGRTLVLGLMTQRPLDVATESPLIQAAFYEFYAARLRQDWEESCQQLTQAAAGMELVTEANQEDNLKSACQTICSRIVSHLDLERVAIGVMDVDSVHCDLKAFSDTTKIDRYRQATRDVELAILTVSQGNSSKVVCSPSEEPAEMGRVSEHWKSPVLVVPFLDSQGNSVGGALLGGSEKELARAEAFLTANGSAIASVIASHRRREWKSKLQTLTSLVGRWPIQVAIASLIIATVILCLPVQHREEFSIYVEPSVRRFVASPDDAILGECLVSPGDLVSEGDLLAKLDEKELTWKRDGLLADLEQLEKKRDSATASRDFTEQKITSLEIEKSRLELDVLEKQLERYQMLSPISGMVVTGDLMRMRGVPVERGQTLFEIAPLDEMVVEIAVPDREIEHLRTGQQASIQLEAIQGEPITSTVLKIHPRSEIRENENVFIAECMVMNERQQLRPGMRGTVEVECGKRSLAWVLFHKPLESLARLIRSSI